MNSKNIYNFPELTDPSYFLLNLALAILFSVSHGIIRPD